MIVITSSQKTELRERGLLRLEGFLPIAVVSAARDVLLRALERQGIWRGGRWCYEDHPAAWPEGGLKLARGAKRSKAFADLVTNEVLAAVDVLMDGQRVVRLAETVQPLLTLPNAPRWTVPHSIWHLDFPRLREDGSPGIQMFAMLDTVAPGGGGTLVVAGSHRLLNDRGFLKSKQVKKLLKRLPYFDELMSRHAADRSRFVETPVPVNGVDQQVVELCGEPGDIYLTDLRLLHTLAPNASPVPRMMASQRFLLASAMDAWDERYGGEQEDPRVQLPAG